MRLLTYVLFLVLLALLGIATVLEKNAAAQTRYQMASVLAEEARLEEALQREHLAWASLMAPENLARIHEERRVRAIARREGRAVMAPTANAGTLDQ